MSGMLLLSGCASVTQVSDSGICKGLKGPIDAFSLALEAEHEKTPTSVLLTGVPVIAGYDSVCP